jgi:hypothetical protein
LRYATTGRRSALLTPHLHLILRWCLGTRGNLPLTFKGNLIPSYYYYKNPSRWQDIIFMLGQHVGLFWNLSSIAAHLDKNSEVHTFLLVIRGTCPVLDYSPF